MCPPTELGPQYFSAYRDISIYNVYILCTYICIGTYIYMYVYIYICIYVHIHTYACIHVYIPLYIYVCTYPNAVICSILTTHVRVYDFECKELLL